MILSCGLADPSWMRIAPVLVAVPLIALRIVAEERLLRAEPVWAAYAVRVRWRLVPLVW